MRLFDDGWRVEAVELVFAEDSRPVGLDP